MADAPRVFFVGMASPFSTAVLGAGLAAGLRLVGVGLSASGPAPVRQLRRPPPGLGLPIVPAPEQLTIAQLAWERDLPVLELSDLGAQETMRACAALRPDVLAVACFDRRIPAALAGIAGLAAVNVHPSLLPHNRGPAPLFWTFRLGETVTGVSIHALAPALDAGDVLVQRSFAIPDGMSATTLEQELAQIGGQLLAEALVALGSGQARWMPQDERLATTHGWPGLADYTIDAGWRVQAAASFIVGVASPATPVRLARSDGQVLISGLCEPSSSPKSSCRDVTLSDGQLAVRMAQPA